MNGKVHDVVWVAATNHPQHIDPAALRGGRFAVKLEFALPDANTLTRFVAGWLRASAARFDQACTPATLAAHLTGMSIANAGAVLQGAADRAVDRSLLEAGSSTVSFDDVRAACASLTAVT